MVLRRGFKKEANDYAREFRLELNLKLHAPLSPWQLAKHLEIPVVPLSTFKAEIPNFVQYLAEQKRECFSALTVFDGNRRLIVHNDFHNRQRQAANVAHELSHAILLHPPTVPFSENGCRNFDKEIEEEANWLGPSLLISEEAALHIVRVKMSIGEAIEFYGASEELITMRINVTGARKRFATGARRSN